MKSLVIFLLLTLIAGQWLGTGLSNATLKQVSHDHEHPDVCHQWDRGNHKLTIHEHQRKTYVKTVNALGLQDRTIICEKNNG